MAAFAQRHRFKGGQLARTGSIKNYVGPVVVSICDCYISQPLVAKARVYAEAFALRGYDRVQLAAAHNQRE